MAINYSSFTNFSGGFKVSVPNTPLDCRFVIEKEADIYNVPLPYVGCIIYAMEEDKFFVVKSVKDGYQDMATGAITAEKPSGEEWIDWTSVSDAALDVYEEFTAGASFDEETLLAIEALGTPRIEAKDAIPAIPAVPEHYEQSELSNPGSLEVVANDYEPFDSATQIRLDDANAKKLEGEPDFAVGDHVLLVPEVAEIPEVPAVPEQEPTGVFEDLEKINEGNALLGREITVSGVGQIGGVKDGDVLDPSMTMAEVVRKLLTNDEPEYIAPTLKIIMDPAEEQQEVGTVINSIFIDYEFQQNDAGPVTRVTRSPVNDSEQAGTTITEGVNNIVYQVIVEYEGGVYKQNSDGEDAGTPIPAGSLRDKFQFTGVRYIWFGCDAGETAVSTSDEVRALANHVVVDREKGYVELVCPIGTRRVTFAAPRQGIDGVTMKKVEYVEQGADYSQYFVANAIKVQGPAGTVNMNYNVFSWVIPVAIEGKMTFRFFYE
jgi:hypothetical protein